MSKEEPSEEYLTPHQRAIRKAIRFCDDHDWPILAKALEHCWGNGFLDIFRKYFSDHAEIFRGMTYGMNQNEHTLEQHACFTDYLKLYEEQLADYIEDHPDGPKADIRDFYKELQAARETGFEDPGTAEFIHCLIASADYDSFYAVMVREAQKLELQGAAKGLARQVPDTAEAKEPGRSPGRSAKEDDEDEPEGKERDFDDDKGYK